MNLLKLSLANLRFQPLNIFLNVLMLAIGIATILTLLQLNDQLEQKFRRDLRGIDLVVGAKGSPLQLILSSVFHLDIPTGNIPLAEAQKLQRNPLVKSTIPLAMGDNYQGFHIVGTTAAYPQHYDARLAAGRLFEKPMEVVLGSTVAAKYPTPIGGKIVGAHGLVDSDDQHADFPYTVVGILASTGTVLDQLVLTSVESVWQVHEHPNPDDAEEMAKAKSGKHDHDHDRDRELTALLITYKSAGAAVTLPRLVNQSSSMQSASPAFELARLFNLISIGGTVVEAFAAVLITIAVIGFFVTLFRAVQERRYDIALMRSLGATRRKIASLLLLEGLGMGIAGGLLGLLLSQGFIGGIRLFLLEQQQLVLESTGLTPYTGYLLLGTLCLSVFAALIPAVLAYRVNVTDVLSRGS